MPDYQGEKFKEYLEKNNLDKSNVALKLGVSRRQVYSYFDSNQLSKKVVARICKGLNVSEDEIFGSQRDLFGLSVDKDYPYIDKGQQGVNDPRETYAQLVRNEIERDNGNRSNATYIGQVNKDQSDEEGNTKFIEISPGRYRMKVDLVPVYARAGYLAGFEDPTYVEELPKHEITVTKYHKGKYLAFEVAGDSMFDGSINSIPDKSTITGREIHRDLWHTRLHTHNHDYWIFVHKTEGVLVKMIKSQDVKTGEIVLESLNPNKDIYPDQVINVNEVEQILNVVKIEREL